MASEYILEDRSTNDKWSIQIDDGEMKWSISVGIAQSEPIIRDSVNTGTYYKLFIEDGEIVIESVVSVQNDIIELSDVTTSDIWRLIISDGQLGYKVEITVKLRINIFLEEYIFQLLDLKEYNLFPNIVVEEYNIFNTVSLEEYTTIDTLEVKEYIAQDLRVE